MNEPFDSSEINLHWSSFGSSVDRLKSSSVLSVLFNDFSGDADDMSDSPSSSNKCSCSKEAVAISKINKYYYVQLQNKQGVSLAESN